MATDYEWNSHLRIVDIGGAYGSFLSQLLSVNKQPIAVLFDQPQVSPLQSFELRAACCRGGAHAVLPSIPSLSNVICLHRS